MRHNKPVCFVISLLLCAAFLAVGFSPAAMVFESDTPAPEENVVSGQPVDTSTDPTAAYESKISDLDAKMKAIQEENKKIESQLKSTTSEKQQAQVKRGNIDYEIKLTKDEIDILAERIRLLENDIHKKLEEIEVKQEEIDESYQLYLKRMRALYMSDDVTTLGLILGADDFTTFLNITDTMNRVAEHDSNLIQELTVQRRELEQTKAELNQRLEELEEDRKATEEKKHQLSGQLQAADLQIHSLAEDEKAYNAELEKNKAMMAAMKKEMDDLYAKIEWSKNPYVGGQMMWPVPGFYTISSNYGWRFGGSDFHTGMDVAGGGKSIYGANVVAANAGTVKYTNWSYTPGRGYGIYVLLDHGGNISTMYAHLSNIQVKVGDNVTAGQVIGNVGSTGWSTGPHLHFEVRVNGQHTNPLPYVKGK